MSFFLIFFVRLSVRSFIRLFDISFVCAFVQTPMKGEPVYMKVDLKISRYVIEMFLKLKEMLEMDGCLYTLLLKAMYRCVQASALWYALIRSILEEH